MKLLKIAALSATVLAGGCATEMAWSGRTGFPSITGSPGRRRSAASAPASPGAAKEEDRTETMYRCMRRHGYVWTTVAVPERRDRRAYYDDYED